MNKYLFSLVTALKTGLEKYLVQFCGPPLNCTQKSGKAIFDTGNLATFRKMFYTQNLKSDVLLIQLVCLKFLSIFLGQSQFRLMDIHCHCRVGK